MHILGAVTLVALSATNLAILCVGQDTAHEQEVVLTSC